MAEIYSSAFTVIVWLGPPSEDSALAICCCEGISSNIKVDFDLQVMPSTSVETHWADGTQCLPLKDPQIKAIYSLLSRNWFTRLWIWQEVVLAQHV